MTEPQIEPTNLLPEKQIQQPYNAMVEIEKSRAVQEVQAALIIASGKPRDEIKCYNKILKACERIGLAEEAIYSLPIGGSAKTGPSIRLAEELARNWGNIKFGFKMIDRSNGRSKCVAYCWDQETNTNCELEFEVEHWIETGKAGDKKKKIITDPIEIDRLEANRAARKIRNCILNVIPGDIVAGAMKKCKATLENGEGEPMIDRIRKCVSAFDKIGVNQSMIEKKLAHTMDLTTAEEIVELQAIYKSLVDKEAKRADFFDFKTEEAKQGGAAGELAEKIKEQVK